MYFRILSFAEVTSTNDVAMAVVEDYSEGTIIVAESQTAGRGQRGNRWESLPGENLTFSVVLEPQHIRAEEQFRVSETAALATADAIRQVTNGRVAPAVKWPNDLYVGDCKIGGILIEHTLQGEYLTRSVVGIGVNVRQRTFDPSLPNPTSLALHEETVEPQALLQAFCAAFSERYAQSQAQLHADYMGYLWRGAGFHSYVDTTTGERFTARIETIDPHTGELALCDSSDALRRYWFKEVEAVL